MKTKFLTLTDCEVEIKKISYAKLKSTVLEAVELVNKLFSLMDNKDEEITKVLAPFIFENIDELENILFRFTDLKPEIMEQVYIEEIPTIFKEILAHNGINVDTIMGFFRTALNKQIPTAPME